MEITTAMPDIASLSTMMAQSKIQTSIGTAVMAQSLDAFQQTGDDIARMMELSVNPGIGGNFDMSV